MVNVIMHGCTGAMGKMVIEGCARLDDMNIVAGVSQVEASCNFPTYYNISDVKEVADVIIDFSNPAALPELLKFAVKTNTAVVIATTGISAEDREKIKEASKSVAVFLSANTSIAMNVLFDIVRKVTAALGEDFDIEIIEKHHRRKVDAPSGTALAIANAVKDVRSDAQYVYERESVRAPRGKNELGIHSIRGGNIVGDHTVIFATDNEIFEITHKAQSRDLFASGAIRIAKYLAGKPSGFYEMSDMLGELV